MNQQPLRLEGPRSPWRAASHGSAALAFEPADAAVVVVSWSAGAADGATSFESRQIELVAEVGANGGAATLAAWTCRSASEPAWLEALSRSQCVEVVLTASTLDSPSSQQAVLELAGLLTRQLQRTKPVVRVRFLPPPPKSRRPAHARR